MSDKEVKAYEALIEFHKQYASGMENMARKILHEYKLLYEAVHGPELFTKERIQLLMRKEYENT